MSTSSLSLLCLLVCAITYAQADLCPDHKSECPTDTTCCPLKAGGYGCCPLKDAVCCKDEVHCCPSGYTCDEAEGRCNKQVESSPLVFNTTLAPSSLNNVICPGGAYQCPNGNTCCPNGWGAWNCCPMVAAVCCADYVHCCPYGTYCDASRGLCYRSGEQSMPWFTKTEAQLVTDDIPAHKLVYPDSVEENELAGNKEDLSCPGPSPCPNEGTCCMQRDDTAFCCKYANGVCCEDKKHCCPSGTGCIRGQCIGKSGESYYPWQLKQTQAKKISSVCPDKISKCPGETPCCQRKDGQWGCCPFENGICCGDGEYCCPHDHNCDLNTHQCVKEDSKVMKKSIIWT